MTLSPRTRVLVKTALTMGLNQSLKLTPQLTQAIRLLAMSTVELETELTELIESNPLLERTEDADPAADAELLETTDAGEQASDDGVERIEIDDALDLETFNETADWTEVRSHPDPDDETSWEARTSGAFDLRGDLRQQVSLMHQSARDRAIAAVLIDAIDDDGYLRESMAALRSALLPEIRAGEDELAAVLRQVQQCTPVGIASRDLRECLTRQLEDQPAHPAQSLAMILVARHLEDLPKAQIAELAVRLQVSEQEVQSALRLIRSLNPRPGERAASSDDYIVPDLIARKQNGRWRLQLSNSSVPAISINRHYEQLAAQSQGDTGKYLRGHLQEARWLVKSLAQRGETLLRVGECVLREQGAFLDYGPQAMRPLTLRQVAEELGLHESTISRATLRKYMDTPRGVFELKRFFSSGVSTSEGGEASAIAIQSMMHKLIAAEDHKCPLSDAALAKQLNRDGIAIARRTVAKYREAMNIPASTDRYRMG